MKEQLRLRAEPSSGSTTMRNESTRRGSRRFIRARAAALSASLAALVGACLPGETRPPPGDLTVTVVGSQAAQKGAVTRTADGWELRFDRDLVSLRGRPLLGDACNHYDDTGYGRLFDPSVPAPQSFALLHGVGTCLFVFNLEPPSTTSILMGEVTAEQKDRMMTGASDRYVERGGASMMVGGSATKGEVVKRFSWAFREPSAVVGECGTGESVYEQPRELVSGESQGLTLEVHPETLFANSLVPGTDLHFQPFADADLGPTDGEVTIDELAFVQLRDAQVTVGRKDVTGTEAWHSLADFVYFGLFPRVVRRSDASWCRVNLSLTP
jgi:hypothetical protein